ncbi:MAG: hypothetical protein U1E05_20100 [Patescibacteria group bacterium]|nr:hypothetical protein [Patescibacteria group bacterium]
MTQALESFIDRLRTDGVESGRKAAEEIRREADREAEKVIREAEAKGKQIVEAAEAQREQTLARTQTDLRLAARDTVGKLREALNQAVNRALEKAVAERFDDSTFLSGLIQQVALQYAGVDAGGDNVLTINVREPMRQKLAHWAIDTFHKGKGKEGKQAGPSVELHGSLTAAGFEYKLAEGTVEITVESVVQVLSEIITPELRKLLGTAAPAK